MSTIEQLKIDANNLKNVVEALLNDFITEHPDFIISIRSGAMITTEQTKVGPVHGVTVEVTTEIKLL